jgi:hypothetical protein
VPATEGDTAGRDGVPIGGIVVLDDTFFVASILFTSPFFPTVQR